MSAAPRLPSAATVAAGSVTVAVLFAAGVIGGTRVLPAINAQPIQTSTSVPADPVGLAEADRYSGVAQVREGAVCTATLVDTQTPTAPGYLLTNGHCASARDLDANAVALGQLAAATATFRMTVGGAPVDVPVARVAYRAMRGTDVSVLELGASLQALQQQGVHGYRLASVAAPTGLPVTNVAIPVTGVDPGAVVLRRGNCTVGPRADLVEFRWLFDDVQANNCPGVVGGSSGSPLFDDHDRVVGMITTTTAGALPGGACYLGTPCERTADGVRVVPDRSYAVSAAGLARCFPAGRFALAEGCPLPRPGPSLHLRKTVYRSTDLPFRGPGSVPLLASRPTPVRVGLAPLTDAPVCLDPATYLDEATAGIGAAYRVELPAREGHYLLCAAEPGREAEAATAVFEVDDTPPVRPPVLATAASGDGYRVEPLFSPPELVGYRVKIGPAATTDCGEPAGYVRYRRVAHPVPADALPARVCVIGADLAGNEAAPWSQELPPR